MANKKRIMIVDDDKDILTSVRQILESNGYKVYSFDNGRDCLKKLKEGKKPTLMILDIMMPEMSGWEIQRRLTENPKWKRIPIIFLTGRDNETAVNMYKRYGIEWIKKPFDINELKSCIERILEYIGRYPKSCIKKCYC